MNTLRIFGLLTLLLIVQTVTMATPRYVVDLSKVHIDFKSGKLPDGRVYNLSPLKDTIWPGDTIGVLGGVRNNYLRLRNLRGTAENPITVINHMGQVFITNLVPGGAMSLKNCRHIRLSGSGDSQFEYGFLLDSTAWGSSSLCLDELTSDVEVHHFEIRRSGFAGIVAKTDPGCDPAAHRGNFTMENLHFHHNYIHHTTGEGFYIGFSFYGPIVKTCSGVTDTVYAHEIKHLRVNDNILDHTGLDGIQIGCATEDVEVYNNHITRSGAHDNEYARYYGMEGIFVGGGSTGSYYNNYIADGYRSGIHVFGTQNVKVFNNVIVRPGRNSTCTLNPYFTYGILHADRFTVPGAAFYFVNNTIISPLTHGIKLMSTESKNIRLYNNIVLDPGYKHHYGSYQTNWMKSCLYVVDGVSYLNQANHFDTVAYDSYYGREGSVDPYFADALNGNFRLKDSTVLINSGVDCDTVCGFHFDADSLPRPSGIGWDLGAYELQQPGNTTFPASGVGMADPDEDEPVWRVFVKHHRITVSSAGGNSQPLVWNIYQPDGKRLAAGTEPASAPEMVLPVDLSIGLFVVTLQTSRQALSQKVMVLN